MPTSYEQDFYELLNDPSYNGNLLYHYTTSSRLFENILVDHSIRFSSPKNFNDPLDYEKFLFINTSNDPKVYERGLLIPKNAKGSYLNSIKFDQSKVACFCQDFDRENSKYKKFEPLYFPLFDKGFCRSSMWTMYAEKHKGVCLVFDKEILLKEIKEFINVFHNGELEIYNKSINYTYDINNLLNSFELKEEETKGKSPTDIFKDRLDFFLFTKLDDYSFENEYRIVLIGERLKKYIFTDVIFRESLLGVVVGHNFPKNYIGCFSIADPPGEIPFLKLNLKNVNPKVEYIQTMSLFGNY